MGSNIQTVKTIIFILAKATFLKKRILLVEPDGWATLGQHKGGCRTQKKAATPKSCDLITVCNI